MMKNEDLALNLLGHENTKGRGIALAGILTPHMVAIHSDINQRRPRHSPVFTGAGSAKLVPDSIR